MNTPDSINQLTKIIKSFMNRHILSLLFLFHCLAHFQCESRIHFLHIPKCGGTTIYSVLQKNFHQDDIHPRDLFSDPMNSEFVTGHFPYHLMLEKDQNLESAFFFTCLRDPIERVLSQYRYMKRKIGIESPLEIYPNMICYMLSSNPDLKGEELLNDCIETLKKMDFIMFFDNFGNWSRGSVVKP